MTTPLGYRSLLCAIAIILVSNAGFAQTSTPQLGHVVIVSMENHSYNDVVGSSSMPYYNSLINQYGLAQNFYANVHGSFPDYAMVTTGELITLNGAGLPSDFPISIDNIERELIAAGKTWKVYAEGLPSVGYTGGDQYPYVKRHNPFAYMTDNLGGSSNANNIVPFSQFAGDVSGNSLPNFSFVVPNSVNDSEDCPGGGSCSDSIKLSTADQWLQNNIAPLLSNSQFQQDGLLVIWWDEGKAADTANGGGRIAVTLVGPTIKTGFRSTTFYRHENLLRTVCEGLGLGFPGASIYVANMAEFFGPRTSATGTISGHVTNSSTGAALAGATLSYSGGSTTTDSSGNYTLSNVATGTVSVTASVSGFTSQTGSVTVTSGDTSTLNFSLAPSSSSPGTISGRVSNSSTGAALAGATLSYSGGSTTTDSSGNYTLSNVAAGAVSVTASLTGFTSQTSSVTVSSGATSTLNFSLAPAGSTPGSISGRVSNISTGGAVSGATVSFSGGSTTTDSSGNYSFSNVAAGTYNITAIHSGYFALTKSANVSSGSSTTLNFAIATGGKVAGTVTNSSGTAISGAAVTVTGGSIGTTVKITTSSTGTYNSNWVPVGTYTVTVSAAGHTTQSKTTTVTTGNTTTLNFTLP
jgi:phosphatidylinositol-3-phosphatase